MINRAAFVILTMGLAGLSLAHHAYLPPLHRAARRALARRPRRATRRPHAADRERGIRMSRITLPLHTAYGVLVAWLGYCAVQSALNGNAWASVLFTVSVALVLTATIREGRLENALRREAVRAERDARLGRPPLDTAECAATVALAAACCEMWWTSAGVDHDSACSRQHRSDAA